MSDETDTNSDSIRYRIRREASGAMAWVGDRTSGFREWFAANWQGSRWFRWGAALLLLAAIIWILGWALLARNLPDAESLVDYEPPLPTMVRGVNGEIVGSYARERRVQLRFADLPRPLINSYLAAEDKTFWSHGGIDVGGFAGAVIDYISKIGSGERAVGGSTITQQVAKNILVGDEYSITRKLREMILARRIEGVLTKEEIITLYLNEIALGRRSYGVQAASRAYFDKDIGDLDLHEMAFLAILPKAPERYGRPENAALALERRNFVLDQMADNDFVSEEDAESAKAQPLGLTSRAGRQFETADAGYFLEEVRRELVEKYGEQAEDGENSVYAGGLWVRTSLDPEMQKAARDSLRKGMQRYHGNRGWRGPIATIDFDEGSWQSQLQSSPLSINFDDWRVGVVTSRSGSNARIGFADGEEAPLSGLPNALKAGDVVAVSPQGNGYRVRTIPEVSGGLVVQDPQTGRVLAMQGGFDSRLGAFNRATQAERQPGSTIKPFVYATGLDNGMTPATPIENGRYCYYQGSRLGEKCFRGGRSGEFPLRYGLEQSQNIMTVRIAMESGMENVIDTFEDVRIGSYNPYPAFALGAGETTVLKMTNAYSALANHGRMFEPTTIDYIQDRAGKVIYRADKRQCTGCNMDEWDGQPMPRFASAGEQVMDARTAFQVAHMLRGVVQRGTAKQMASLDLPIFGKTGTTTGPKETWFVGGSQDYMVGVYLGFDRPRNMGGYAQGGTVAAPIVQDLIKATKARWSQRPLVAPAGVQMMRIDRRSGGRVFNGWPGSDNNSAIIWEAFKPDTEPPRRARQDDIDALRAAIIAQLRAGEAAVRGQSGNEAPTEDLLDFVEEQGGIY